MRTEHTRTPERVLILGCTAFTGFDSTSWMDQQIPNIPDYDVVVVSVPHITEDFLKSVTPDHLKRLRTAFVTFLHSGGKIVVLVSPRLTVNRSSKYPQHVSNIDWCPIFYATPQETGKSIVVKDKAYASYLKRLSEWDFHLTIPTGCLSTELTDFYGYHTAKLKVPLRPYLENRYGRVLAGQFHIEVRNEIKTSNTWNSWSEYPQDPDHTTGSVVLLPLIGRVSPEEALAQILEIEIGRSLESPEPDWSQNIEMPGVPELLHRVGEVKTIIEQETAKVQELEGKIADIQSFRRLLYGTGSELEAIVKRSLEHLGATVSPSKYSQEEYILEFAGKEFLMEVKGVAKSIALSHIRQLNDYLLKYQEDTGKICKGVLFGTAWRNTPPKLRGLSDTQEFPDNVVKRAEEWGISLVSSTAFFEAFVKAFQDPKLANDILVKITTSSGVAFF